MKENPDNNVNADNERIDELLNSYIDDELSAEQLAEVEKLIDKDEQIAQRLRQLRKCQILISSMPSAEAPAGVLEGVKASLAAVPSHSAGQGAYQEHAGKKYLLVRKVLAAAAMIAFAAVLSAVINRNLPPRNTNGTHVAVETSKPANRVAAASAFSGRLELKTSSFAAVDALIKNAIDDNGLSASISPEGRQSRRVYRISCTKGGLNSLLTDLDDIWPEINSATLFVNMEEFCAQAVVKAVTVKQISEIASQDNPEKRIELAKDFAVANSITENLPDKEIRFAIEAGNSTLTKEWRMTKPVLTSEKPVTKPADQARDKQAVHLTIILEW
jgi:anti-sigma-K factor RskA